MKPANTSPQSTKASDRILFCLVLAVWTAAALWPIRNCPFIDFDDFDYVTKNEHVQKGFTIEGIKWAFTTGHASNWHPMTWLSHMLDCQLFGTSAVAHHSMNLLYHICNAVLLFLVLERIMRLRSEATAPQAGSPRRSEAETGFWRSGIVAALFALHPLHIQSVAWVSERKDVLSAFFWLLTMLAYFEFARKRGAWRYVVTLFLCACALMSKPMAVTLPFALLLLDVWPLRRIEVKAANGFKAMLKGFGPLIWEKIPFFILVVACCGATYWAQSRGGTVVAATTLSLGGRFANALIAYVRYLGKTFWPVDLCIFYPHPGVWETWRIVASGLLLVAISVVVIRLGRARPYLLVGWLWFLGTLVPVIGVIQAGIHSMADRFTYIPLIGIFAMLAWSIPAELIKKSPIALWTGWAVLILICSAIDRVELKHWKNTETLFAHAVDVTQNNYLALNMVGRICVEDGRYEQGINLLTKAVRMNPTFHYAQKNLAYAFEKTGNPRKAVEHYELSIQAVPNDPEAHRRLANVLSDLGDSRCNEQFRETLRQKPSAEIYNDFGVALAMQQKMDEAMDCFKQALRLDPKNTSAMSNLGNALAAQKKFDEAAAQYAAVLRIEPDDPKAHENFAIALSEQGKLEEAIAECRAAIKLAPDFRTHLHCGRLLVRLKRNDEAKVHFQEALRLKSDCTEAQQQLAAMK